MVSEFGKVLVFLMGAIIFLLVPLGISRILRRQNPNTDKLSVYESGEEALGTASNFFNIRFYLVALVFVLFDVEIVFLFPWAVIFGQKELQVASENRWAWWAISEMYIFVGVLVLGLAYVWVKGYLDWVKPAPQVPTVTFEIPKNLYEDINQKYKKS